MTLDSHLVLGVSTAKTFKSMQQVRFLNTGKKLTCATWCTHTKKPLKILFKISAYTLG